MKALAIIALVALLVPMAVSAQVSVTVDPVTMINGFMNVYNLPADGGAFQFASGWAPADLTAIFAGSDVTLGPNTIGDPNEYWYQCVGAAVPPNCGGPGAPGNKIMEANFYAEETGPLAGTTVVFSGNVVSNSFTSAHTVTAFIRDFAPDFSSFNETVLPLTAVGSFSLNLATINDPARHVQYGFQTVGVNVWVTDTAPFGTMVIGPTPPVGTEETTWGKIKALYN